MNSKSAFMRENRKSNVSAVFEDVERAKARIDDLRHRLD
jgi:hypothetical protein|uniref:Uncharacterized protein n=1 Tax=Myoviridae sp. ctakU3 TaxID=2825135 RepID=A0A8S5P1V7_9CAUD|nr:MAG TPA: hypothetical protein [Myoviridae sp. ctakU3]